MGYMLPTGRPYKSAVHAGQHTSPIMDPIIDGRNPANHRKDIYIYIKNLVNNGTNYQRSTG